MWYQPTGGLTAQDSWHSLRVNIIIIIIIIIIINVDV